MGGMKKAPLCRLNSGKNSPKSSSTGGNVTVFRGRVQLLQTIFVLFHKAEPAEEPEKRLGVSKKCTAYQIRRVFKQDKKSL